MGKKAKRKRAEAREEARKAEIVQDVVTIEEGEKPSLMAQMLIKVREAEARCLKASKTNKDATAWQWFKGKMAWLARVALTLTAWALKKIIQFLDWVSSKWDANKDRLKKAWRSLTEEVKELEVPAEQKEPVAAQ